MSRRKIGRLSCKSQVKRTLERHDWDFSECPQDELAICYRYEYGRESKMGQAVQNFRRWEKDFKSVYDQCMRVLQQRGFPDELDHKSEEFWKIASTASALRLHFSFDCFSRIPDFPDRPWLALSADLRMGFMTTVGEIGREAKLPLALRIVAGKDLEKYNWSVWHDLRQSMRPDAIQGWFEIPAGFSKKEILDQFNEWLGSISKGDPQFFSTKSGGRGGPMDKLNQLGAYRLMCGRSPTQAFNFVRGYKNQDGETLYLYDNAHGTGNAWYRARDEAKEEIERFDKSGQELIGLLNAIKSVAK